MRFALAALGCTLACACAKAPDASPRATADATGPAAGDAGPSLDGGRPFGLPMPQQYPHFVWDAGAADASRDGGTAPVPLGTNGR